MKQRRFSVLAGGVIERPIRTQPQSPIGSFVKAIRDGSETVAEGEIAPASYVAFSGAHVIRPLRFPIDL
jgi:hypothetical protein